MRRNPQNIYFIRTLNRENILYIKSKASIVKRCVYKNL